MKLFVTKCPVCNQSISLADLDLTAKSGAEKTGLLNGLDERETVASQKRRLFSVSPCSDDIQQTEPTIYIREGKALRDPGTKERYRNLEYSFGGDAAAGATDEENLFELSTHHSYRIRFNGADITDFMIPRCPGCGCALPEELLEAPHTRINTAIFGVSSSGKSVMMQSLISAGGLRGQSKRIIAHSGLITSVGEKFHKGEQPAGTKQGYQVSGILPLKIDNRTAALTLHEISGEDISNIAYQKALDILTPGARFEINLLKRSSNLILLVNGCWVRDAVKEAAADTGKTIQEKREIIRNRLCANEKIKATENLVCDLLHNEEIMSNKQLIVVLTAGDELFPAQYGIADDRCVRPGCGLSQEEVTLLADAPGELFKPGNVRHNNFEVQKLFQYYLPNLYNSLAEAQQTVKLTAQFVMVSSTGFSWADNAPAHRLNPFNLNELFNSLVEDQLAAQGETGTWQETADKVEAADPQAFNSGSLNLNRAPL